MGNFLYYVGEVMDDRHQTGQADTTSAQKEVTHTQDTPVSCASTRAHKTGRIKISALRPETGVFDRNQGPITGVHALGEPIQQDTAVTYETDTAHEIHSISGQRILLEQIKQSAELRMCFYVELWICVKHVQKNQTADTLRMLSLINTSTELDQCFTLIIALQTKFIHALQRGKLRNISPILHQLIYQNHDEELKFFEQLLALMHAEQAQTSTSFTDYCKVLFADEETIRSNIEYALKDIELAIREMHTMDIAR